MANHTLSYHPCQGHPLFLSSTILEYIEEVKNQSSINFGKIYLTLLYNSQNFTVFNCNGIKLHNPRFQLRPVSNYFSVSAEKGSKLIILALKPTRWFAITGKPAYLYNENVLDMEDIFPGGLLKKLYTQCAQVSDAERIPVIFDAHLSKYYKEWQKPCPIDDVAEIFERQGMIKLKYLVEKYPFARSTLGSYFKKYIGYSPNFFIRLVQFNNIIREVENNGNKLSELIRSYNFYDYTHFKKDFQLFTGTSPTHYPNSKFSSMENFFKKIDY